MAKRREPGEARERKRSRERLRAIVEGTATKTGDEFFRSLVRHLAAALGVEHVFVGEVLLDEPQRVTTLAVWAGDDFGNDFEYELADTPCAEVVNQGLCFYPKEIRQRFPRDRLLAEARVQSYLGAPLFDSSGRPLGLLVAMDGRPMDEDPQGQDLLKIFAGRAGAELERQRAAAALLESETRSRLIIETMLDAVITIDPQSTVTGWNARAEEIFGWTQAEAIGRVLVDLIIPPEFRDAHRRGVERFLETGEGPLLGKRIEIEGLHKNGRRLPVELAIATMRSGDSYEFSAFLQDISERKRAEEERARLESQIQHAQKLESLGVLAGGIAHDFNNLLTGILGNAGIARRELPSDHPVQQRLAEVLQGSEIASHLTGQLLDYAGRGQMQSRPVDLSAEARALESLLRTSVRERGSLQLDLATGLPAIRADPGQLHQVLMNLAINAAESSEEKVQIRIRTRTVELAADELSLLVPGSPLAAGHHVALEVEDDGRGLEDDTQKRIFDPFFTTKANGRGLGLAAMLGIVHQHGGGIRVRSSPSTGSRFQILFPASGEPVEQAPEVSARNLTGRGLVLVVDDDEYVLEAVRHSLESYGYSAIVAESGERAVEIFRERQAEIDMVVLDLIMGGMDGGETFEVLRNIRPDVRVLLSTGYDTTKATRRVATDSLAGVLRKPYLPEQLAAEVKRLLGNDRGAPLPAESQSQLADLRASYRSKLPELLSGLASAVRAARPADASEQSRREAWQLAHRIKGTAGSYGFDEVAESLAAIDALLEGMIERSEARESEWLEIEKALARAVASLGAC